MRRACRLPVLTVLSAIAITLFSSLTLEALCAYCDFYYYCDGWDGSYCYTGHFEEQCAYYNCDDGGGGGGGGGGGTEDPITVQITNASIENNEIVVKTSPAYRSGRLEVLAILGNTTSHTILDETRSGGEYHLPFDEYSLPNGEYVSVTATWHPGYDVYSIFPIGFYVLGIYHHTQYNTPSESACSGQHVDRDVSPDVNHCTPTITANLKYGFTQQLDLNGSGRSEDFGLLQVSGTCHGSSHYTKVSEINGSHGPVDDSTVAKMPGTHPHLYWNDDIKIVNAPAIAIKNVTDSCPACDETHLDNYNSTSSACSGHALGDLPNVYYQTIRLRGGNP